jgi:hypothetical protein
MQSFAFSITNPNAIMAAIRFRPTSSTRENGFTTVSLEPNKIKGPPQWGAFFYRQVISRQKPLKADVDTTVKATLGRFLHSLA